MKPVAQRDLTRPRARRQALRDNRRLFRISPVSPPRRSGQNLHSTKTVPINWQITWHTIPRAHHAGKHNTVATGCEVGVRLRLQYSSQYRLIYISPHSSGDAANLRAFATLRG